MNQRTGDTPAGPRELRLFENLEAMPPAFLVHRVRVERDSGAQAQAVSARIDPRREVVLDDEPSPSPTAAEEPFLPAQVVSRTRTRLEEVETEDPNDAVLVVSETMYPGWRAQESTVSRRRFTMPTTRCAAWPFRSAGTASRCGSNRPGGEQEALTLASIALAGAIAARSSRPPTETRYTPSLRSIRAAHGKASVISVTSPANASQRLPVPDGACHAPLDAPRVPCKLDEAVCGQQDEASTVAQHVMAQPTLVLDAVLRSDRELLDDHATSKRLQKRFLNVVVVEARPHDVHDLAVHTPHTARDVGQGISRQQADSPRDPGERVAPPGGHSRRRLAWQRRGNPTARKSRSLLRTGEKRRGSSSGRAGRPRDTAR